MRQRYGIQIEKLHLAFRAVKYTVPDSLTLMPAFIVTHRANKADELAKSACFTRPS